MSIMGCGQAVRPATMHPLALCVSLALAVSLSTAAAVEAQQARYVGRATGAVILDGPLAPNGPVLEGDVGAGGPGEDDEAVCDVREALCFDEAAAGAGIPDLLAISDVRTVGGAFSESGDPRPGFPRVESTATGVFLGIPGVLEIGISEVLATADAETGELDGQVTGLVVRLADQVEIPVPGNDVLELPGIGTLLAGNETIIEKDGLKMIQVDGATLESETLGNIVLGRVTAGLELATTSGGSFGGGDGCAAAPGGGSADGALVLGSLALLIALRRRRARSTAQG